MKMSRLALTSKNQLDHITNLQPMVSQENCIIANAATRPIELLNVAVPFWTNDRNLDKINGFPKLEMRVIVAAPNIANRRCHLYLTEKSHNILNISRCRVGFEVCFSDIDNLQIKK